MRPHYEDMNPSHFRHTQFAVYSTALVTALAVGYDSCQGIVQRYHINKKWFYLYGFMSMFAYLYVRPLIRKRLGSASGAYINWSTVYAVWLCAAVFYHLPSLESMGFDIKADVSILLNIFMLSCVLLGMIVVCYGVLFSFRTVSTKFLYIPPSSKEMFSIVVLNSLTLALACSTYYSFCGNAAIVGEQRDGRLSGEDAVRRYVCMDVLKPLPARRHSAYGSWMIYGDMSVEEETGLGDALVQREDQNYMKNGVISPVFTTWLTLFALIICNSLADFASAYCVKSAYYRPRGKGEFSKTLIFCFNSNGV